MGYSKSKTKEGSKLFEYLCTTVKDLIFYMLQKMEHQLHEYGKPTVHDNKIKISFHRNNKNAPVSTLNHNTS